MDGLQHAKPRGIRTSLYSCCVFSPAPYSAPTIVTAAKAPVHMNRLIVVAPLFFAAPTAAAGPAGPRGWRGPRGERGGGFCADIVEDLVCSLCS
jgi:hypothetical protein